VAGPPLIFWLARRFPINRATLARHLPLHLAGFLVAHAAHEVAYVLLERAAGMELLDGTRLTLSRTYRNRFQERLGREI
jgi:hypothetical protein